MTFTVEFSWWNIPTLITMCGLVWALFIVKDDHGYLAGISNIFALIPALAVSAIAWAIAGALK